MFNIRLKTESAEITFKDITEKESISFTDNRRFNYYIWNNSEYIIMINSNVSKNRLRITICAKGRMISSNLKKCQKYASSVVMYY